MWHFRGERQVVVNPDGAELEHFAGTNGFIDVTSPDGCCQAVDDIVGFCQGLFFSLEAADDDDRTKHFGLHDFGVVAILCDNGWFEEEALLAACNDGTFATCDNIGSGTQCTFDKSFNVITLAGGD